VAARAAAEAPTAGQTGASLGAQFARSLGTSIAPMLYRSQGLQMIRDFQFTLCVMRMNNVITNEQYLSALTQTLPEAVKLMTAEMPAILKAAERPVPNVNAPTINLPAVTVFDATKASGS
jgi:predicted alpha/beta-fold hydrolase